MMFNGLEFCDMISHAAEYNSDMYRQREGRVWPLGASSSRHRRITESLPCVGCVCDMLCCKIASFAMRSGVDNGSANIANVCLYCFFFAAFLSFSVAFDDGCEDDANTLFVLC